MATEAKCRSGQILGLLPLANHVLATALRRSGLLSDGSHLRLLASVSDGPVSIDDLAERQAMSLPAMSSCVTTLAERGWVSSSPLEQDRRHVMVELTPAGREALSTVEQCLHAFVDDHLRSLSPEECETLANGLRILERVLYAA